MSCSGPSKKEKEKLLYKKEKTPVVFSKGMFSENFFSEANEKLDLFELDSGMSSEVFRKISHKSPPFVFFIGESTYELWKKSKTAFSPQTKFFYFSFSEKSLLSDMFSGHVVDLKAFADFKEFLCSKNSLYTCKSLSDDRFVLKVLKAKGSVDFWLELNWPLILQNVKDGRALEQVFSVKNAYVLLKENFSQDFSKKKVLIDELSKIKLKLIQ